MAWLRAEADSLGVSLGELLAAHYRRATQVQELMAKHGLARRVRERLPTAALMSRAWSV